MSVRACRAHAVSRAVVYDHSAFGQNWAYLELRRAIERFATDVGLESRARIADVTNTSQEKTV